MDKPVSVEQLVKDAGHTFFDVQFPMANWFRTADLMLKQASRYEHEGNDQMAYLLLYRHAHLILDDLPAHPQAKDGQFKQQWSEARKSVRASLGKMEMLKPKINKSHEGYQKRLKVRALQNTSEGSGGNGYNDYGPRPSGDYNDRQEQGIDTDEHKGLAVRLANREVRRRMRVGQGPEEDTTSMMIATRRELDQTFHTVQAVNSAPIPSSRPYNYPSAGVVTTSTQSRDRPLSIASRSSGTAPLLPPKTRLDSTTSNHPQTEFNPPLPPQKISTTTPTTNTTTTTRPSTPEPIHQFASTSHTESGSALRTIFLPAPLRHSFLHHATANTARNLETCGILCGTLIRNAFFITKLVIPLQTSTSDTCEMVDEAALYAYIDGQPEELMVLGWIHTHPTQTCFMSSRDLHTHVWFQVQLPESIAIVCSPSKSPDRGIFRLTDPPGMQAIRTCKQPGIFHPHAETQLFTDALGRPGHVVEHADLQFDVVDLRTKS